MLWDCLEQLITDKRGQLGEGGGRGLSGSSRYSSQGLAHLSEGDLDNLFYQQDNLLYTNRIDISHSGH